MPAIGQEARGGGTRGGAGVADWAGGTLSSCNQRRLELSVCAMAVLRHRRGLWGSELTSHRGPSKAGELGACPLRHQQIGTQLPRDRKRKCIQQQVSKYPLMEEIGFLVLGMRAYHVRSESDETQNQNYGRSVTKETLKEGVSRVFFHHGFCLRKDAVAASIGKMERILQWFERQKQLNFYAGSLLLAYEGSPHPATTKSNDRTSAEKFLSEGQLPDTDALEYNNNFQC
ncbi:hypothetical protein QTO34_010364 [Cnephaeus nilssonii]|uniref:Kinase n=1 Tax=Cnephaeus nilssonii TaxID=3371016 RepID=A0AA40LFY4_CNENI|nr:hypothetical protein QTO34_010364 [Eptesicus nilssonii]